MVSGNSCSLLAPWPVHLGCATCAGQVSPSAGPPGLPSKQQVEAGGGTRFGPLGQILWLLPFAFWFFIFTLMNLSRDCDSFVSVWPSKFFQFPSMHWLLLPGFCSADRLRHTNANLHTLADLFQVVHFASGFCLAFRSRKLEIISMPDTHLSTMCSWDFERSPYRWQEVGSGSNDKLAVPLGWAVRPTGSQQWARASHFDTLRCCLCALALARPLNGEFGCASPQSSLHTAANPHDVL